MMKRKILSLIPLLGIVVLAAFFRLYNVNWDSGYHLHPDERAITMFSMNLTWPKSFEQFLTPQSPLDPHFFAYGSFPLYFLQGTAHLFQFIDSAFPTYDKMNLLGRLFSAFFDTGTIVLLFAISRKLWNNTVGLVASFLYAVSVLPIQLSHFYAVDTLLTFFIIMTLLQLIRFYEKPSIIRGVFVGIFFGFSLATKISALVLLVSLGVALSADFLLIVFRKPHSVKEGLSHLSAFIKHLLFYSLLILITAAITYCILEPYALIDHKEFLDQNLQQAAMTKDAFTFPYTLQYVGKIPYLYEIKNIFFWGMGPLLAIICFLGILFLTYKGLWKEKKEKSAKELIILAFFWIYVFIVGKFAIGFMRYMLPIYPILCIGGAFFVNSILSSLKWNKYLRYSITGIIIIFLLIWPFSFIQIYTKPNTRVTASIWITTHIPPGDTIAIEHWDDGLPLFDQQQYTVETLELYNPDTPEKWEKINEQLARSDYYIIASNRLYVPLQKLTDCSHLPPDRCYPQTAEFYKNLFSGNSNFKKVAEFTDSPHIPFTSITINDQSADESFTVYDHPKVLIFKREK